VNTTKPNPAAHPEFDADAEPPHAEGERLSPRVLAGLERAGDDHVRASLSITDFMTDGSLTRLAKHLSETSGVLVTLHQPDGRVLRALDTEPYWRAEDPAGLPTPKSRVQLRAGEHDLGEFRIASHGHMSPRAIAETRVTLELVAAAAEEVCQNELELRTRVREMEVLHRLSAMLADASDVDAMLQIALDSAIDTLAMDAGSTVLFQDSTMADPSEEGLTLKASRNMSAQWLEDPRPLSKNRAFDRAILEEGVLTIEDLRADDRVLHPERLKQEGLVGFITAALRFREKPIGAIRLYSRKPRRFWDAERRLVRSIAHQAAVAVAQARLLDVQTRQAKLQRQLELARDVQQRMLPSKLPSIDPVELQARYIPSAELAGDFYDVFTVGDETEPKLALVVGDVVGKGVPAALMMSSVRATLRGAAESTSSPDEMMNEVNHALCRDTLASEFVTLWVGVVNPETLELCYCSAGHEPPIIASPTKPPRLLEIGGMVAGVDEHQKYRSVTTTLDPGDALIAYTDGLTEAPRFDGQRFGRQGTLDAIADVFTEHDGADASYIADGLLWRLRRFTGLHEREDDLTLLVARVGSGS